MSGFSSDIEIEIVSERLSDHYLISPNDLHRGQGPWQGLTPAARCLLSALLTYSTGWKVQRSEINEIMAPLGREATDTVLKELRKKRFISTKRRNAAGGRFCWQWKVSLRPQPEESDKDVSAGRTIDGSTMHGQAVDGEPVDGGDQGKDAVSAGRTIDGSTVDGQPVANRSTTHLEEPREETTSYATSASPSSRRDESEITEKSSTKKPKTEPRGTRLPDDFSITPAMADWARANVPDLAGKGETDKFLDYYRAAPGVKGRKTDWPAAWRNWMRKAAEDLAARGNRPAQRGGSTAPFRSSRRENPFAGLDVVKSSDIIREMQEAQS